MADENKNNKKPEIEDLSSLSSLNPSLSATTNSGVGKFDFAPLGVGKANNGHGTGTRGDTV